jgi:PAS domain S-box-containing protein
MAASRKNNFMSDSGQIQGQLSAFHYLNDPAFVTYSDSRIIFINKAAEMTFDLAQNKCVGRPLSEILDSTEAATSLKTIFEDMTTKLPTSYRGLFRTYNGRAVHAACHLHLFNEPKWGSGPFILAIFGDSFPITQNSCYLPPDIYHFGEMSLNPVLFVNHGGHVSFQNNAAAIVLRHASAEMQPEKWLPEDMPEIMASLEKHPSTSYKREVRLGYGFYSLEISYLSRIEHALVRATDVSAHKIAERAFWESENRCRELINRISSAVIVMDAVEGARDFIIREVNRAWEKKEKIEKDSALGKRMREILPNLGENGVDEALRRVWMSGRSECLPITTIIDNRLAGRFECCIYRLPSWEVVMVSDDITEYKKAEFSLKESEKLFRLLFEMSSYGNLLMDEKKFIDCNQSALQMLGFKSKKKIIGLTPAEISPPRQADGSGSRESADRLYDESYARGNLQFEWICMKTDGNLIPVEVHLSAIPIHGKTMVLVSLHNIHERKMADQKIMEYQKKLRSLTSQLVLAEERERRQIATELHDQIGQMLAVAKIRLLKLENLKEEAQFRSQVKDISDVLDQIVSDVRTLSCELTSLVLFQDDGMRDAIREMGQQKLAEHGIRFEYEQTGPKIMVPEEKRIIIYQTVRELLNNLIKHAHAKTVKISMSFSKHLTTVSVSDDGIGFDTGSIQDLKIREHFGLFNIRERIEYFHGSLQIESKPGSGTKATIKIPM